MRDAFGACQKVGNLRLMRLLWLNAVKTNARQFFFLGCAMSS